MTHPIARPAFSTLQIWAFRDLLKRPCESLLLATALTLTIASVGTLLVFPRALYDTVDRLLSAAPSIVVRRVDATGWRPLPTRAAVQAASRVIGVVSAKPRIWGIVKGPQGPVTIVGMSDGALPAPVSDYLARAPGRGQAVVGPGVGSSKTDGTLQLEGALRSRYQVTGRLPDETSIFTHDLVLLNVTDARQLIGLAEGYASDLAVDVFHGDEEDAILADLAAAFPWPVRCITRRQSAGIHANGLNRGAALAALAVVPAVLAICLLVAVNIRRSMGRQTDLGVMKAIGWTTGDIVRLQLYRALYVGLPSAAAGICLSLLLVYWPAASWLGRIFLGWETLPPLLYLEPQGAVTLLLEVAGFILAPVFASALMPAIKGATTDVHDLIEGAGSR
jgi:hypothetical protein